MTKEREDLEKRITILQARLEAQKVKKENERLQKEKDKLESQVVRLEREAETSYRPYRRYFKLLSLALGIVVAGTGYAYVKHLEPKIEIRERLVAETEIVERYEAEKEAKEKAEGKAETLSSRLKKFEDYRRNQEREKKEMAAQLAELKSGLETKTHDYERAQSTITDLRGKLVIEKKKGEKAERQLYKQENNQAKMRVVRSEWDYSDNYFRYRVCEEGGVAAILDQVDIRIWKLDSGTENPSQFKQRTPYLFKGVPMLTLAVEANQCSGKDVFIPLRLSSYRHLLQEREWIEATISGKDSYGHPVSFVIEGYDQK